MALTAQRFAQWSAQHQQAVLGSRAGAFRAASGAKQQRILAAAYKTFLTNKADAAQVYDPNAVLSGRSLKSAANALTDQTINPQLQALDQQSQTVTGQGSALARRSSDYYQQLAQQEAQSLAAAQAIAAQANAASSAAAAQAQGSVTQAQQAEQQRQAQDQNVRGGGLEGGGQSAVAQALAQRLASVAQTGQAASQDTAAQGGNYGGLSAAIAGAAGLKGGEAQGAISGSTQSALQKIAGQRSGVLSARGAEFVKNLTGLRTSEFNKAATAQGLGLKTTAAANAESDKAASRALTKRGQNLSAADRRANRTLAGKKFATAQEKDAYERAHHLGPYKTPGSKGTQGLTPAQVTKASNTAVDGIRKAQSLIRAYEGKKNTDGSAITDAQIRATLSQTLPVDYVNAAFDIQNLGGLSHKTVQSLHARGVKIGDRLPLAKPGALSKQQQQQIAGIVGGGL